MFLESEPKSCEPTQRAVPPNVCMQAVCFIGSAVLIITKADYIAGNKGYTITKLHTHTKFSIFPPFIRSLPTKNTCRKALAWQSFKLKWDSVHIEACYKKT